MDFKNLGKLISQDAPLVGAAISTVNPMAGFLITALSKLFSGDPTNADDLLNKINNDPQSSIKLRQLELDHQSILNTNEVDDRKNAREREEEIIKTTGKRDYILDCIAFFVIVGYLFFCYLIIFVKFDDTTYHVVWMIAGQFSTAVMMILSFYFGASNK